MLVGMFAGRILGLVGDSTSQSVIDGVFAIAAYSSGLLLGLLLLGILPKPVSSRSATLGFVVALLVVTTIKFSTSLAWPWFAVLGPALVVSIAYGCDPWLRGPARELQTD